MKIMNTRVRTEGRKWNTANKERETTQKQHPHKAEYRAQSRHTTTQQLTRVVALVDAFAGDVRAADKLLRGRDLNDVRSVNADVASLGQPVGGAHACYMQQ
jgi:predicted nucleotidyltransferase component of viral defense system